MKTITIILPDGAICGELVYVEVTEKGGMLNSFPIPDIADGSAYTPDRGVIKKGEGSNEGKA